MMPSTPVRFLPSGDAALVVEFGDQVDRQLSRRVLGLSARVRAGNIAGVIETVPTFRSLMIHYDPVTLDYHTLVAAMRTLLDANAETAAQSRLWRIPACYESAYAPDLVEVAARTGRSADDVIRAHTSTDFHVYMIGFAPGHPYLGDLPEWLSLPRRADPRIKVDAGSIGIAGVMSVIYPMESPGGWSLIGTTPVRLFDVDAARPSLLAPGDQIRFECITSAEFDEIRRAVESGAYRVPIETISSNEEHDAGA